MAFAHHRHAHNRDDVQLARRVEHLHQSQFGFLQQKLLGKQVATGISGDAQLGKGNDLHTLAVGNDNLFFNLSGVELTVRHVYPRHSRRHFHVSVIHKIGV